MRNAADRINYIADNLLKQYNMINDDKFWEIPSSIDLEGFIKKYTPDFKYKIDHF